MRLFFVALGIAAFTVIGWVFWRATEETREWNRLLACAGKDLTMADAATKAVIRRFCKRTRTRLGSQMEPWRVLVLGGGAAPRKILVVHADTMVPIPSDFLLEFDVLDENRRPRSFTPASAGWRIIADDVRSIRLPEVGSWTFEVLSRRTIGGADVGRQIYGLVDDIPVLIRLEDSRGKYYQNNYEYPNNTIGPDLPTRTPEEWDEALHSSDPGEVLRTLVWIGGHHATPVPWEDRVGHETLEASFCLSNTRSRTSVMGRLVELKRSPHPWIAEAARAALAGETPVKR